MKINGTIAENLRLAIMNKLFQDNLMRRIVKNASIVLSGNSISSALNIISFTIMANQLGPGSLAILVLAQTYTLIINDMFNVQTWESMLKFGSIKSKNLKLANIVKTNILLDVISAIAAFVFATLLLRPVVSYFGWDELLLNIASLYCLSILFNLTSLTIGIPRLFNKFYSIAKIQVATSSLKLMCVIYAMYSSETIIFYVAIYLIADILTNVLLIILSMVLLRNKLNKNWWRSKTEIIRDQIRFIWWTNLRTIIRIPVQRLDMVVISSVVSIEMVGIYKVYKEIASLMSRVSNPINQSIYPEFTKLLGSNEIKRTASIAKKTILLLSSISLIITLTLLFASEFIITGFFGAEYMTQINALYAMLVLFGFKLITAPINPIFIASGFAKSSVKIVLLSNIVFLVSAFMFSKIIGIYGVILAYTIQWALNKGLKICLLRKYSSDLGRIIR